MRATIIQITPVMVLGKTADGEKVFFALSSAARRAKVGDIFAFTPEEPKMLRRKDIKWFGRTPLLVGHAKSSDDFATEETEGPGLALTFESKIKSLPDHHEKNYTRGRLVLGPRPCELEAQRIALSRIQTAQTSAS